MFVKESANAVLLTLLLALGPLQGASAAADRVTLSGHVPGIVAGLAPTGRLPAQNNLALAIGLPLRQQDALDELLVQLYDPQSTNFHKFLSPEEFTARFGPTEQDYQTVIKYAEANGLTVTGKHPNRVVLDVKGKASDIERAFQVTLRTYKHPTETRDFFAPDTEPSVPTNLPVADMWGLTDYGLPRPLSHQIDPQKITPLNYNGSGPSGAYQGGDFRNAYVPGVALTGTGQTAAVAEFDGYYANDITSYEAQCGYAAVPLQNVLLDGVSGNPGYSGQANAVAEVSLDIELIIAMAPGLSKVIVYEGSSPYDVFNKIVTDNTAKQISCSWSWSVGPTHSWVRHSTKTLDSQLQQMAAQGQSFFVASGDSDAYTGTQALSSSSGPIPVDSIYVTSVGGTSLTMNGSGASWSSETVWNWGNNTGSGGGISQNYTIPSWQASVSMAFNSGSTVNRNVPDVALTADAVQVDYNNGSSGAFGGTSCAAPLWAGFCALVNQQATAGGGTNVGFLNPALYAIAAGPNYTACFHDITTGNNIGSQTAGLYYATNGYDLATGLGTPKGINLINALAPPLLPYFTAQPTGKTVTNGTSLTLSATASGAALLSYYWLFNNAILSAGGNISGVNSNVLSITAATTNNSGNYSLVVTDNSGSVTSSVAVLSVGFAPAISAQPANLTIPSGSNAVFSATVSGSPPLVYQWRKSGINLVNGAGISGATSNLLTLTAVTTNSSGNYNLYVTNNFGAVTSSVAALTVVLPPAIMSSSLTNQTVQCGSNNITFAFSASGTAPLNYQWILDGVPISNATNTSFSLTNVHLPNHTVAVTVTNLYGSVTNDVVITVLDTLAPVITINGGNPIYVELGGSFTDPGATAIDICAGSVPVSTGGVVNVNVVGTNLLSYIANDGNGNNASITRTVIVRDTTPPTILWSFTNLVLAADFTCSAVMPDLTGTNYILATDLSGTLTISQSPTSNSALPLGTNVVVITVKDTSGNTTYSTNAIVVQDQTPPQIGSQPQSQTNFAGTTVNFSVSATACTPLAYQWFFNNIALTAETNTTLTLSNISSATSGYYLMVATSTGGSSTSAVASLTVNLMSSTVALASLANPSGYKDNLDFTAGVTPTNATGSIQFFTNGVTFDLQALTAGQALSTNISSLPRGTNIIMAVYSGDANFLPATNTLQQIVTNHPPTAVAAFYNRVAGSPLTIAVTNLATNWTDIDGDTISLTGVSVSTNGVTITNNSGMLTYFNPNNVADLFTCTISDGFGGTNVQTVNIAVVPPPNIVGVTCNPDGSIILDLTGAPGSSYILEARTNLISSVNWQPVATNILDASGAWQFTDAQATNFQQRFYRLKLAQ